MIKAPKFHSIEIKVREGIHRNLALDMPFTDNESFLKCSPRYLKGDLWRRANYHTSFKSWVYLAIIISFITKQLISNS